MTQTFQFTGTVPSGGRAFLYCAVFNLNGEGVTKSFTSTIYLTSITLDKVSGNQTVPTVYLNLWEGNGTGAYTYVGSSANADYADQYKGGTWRFNSFPLDPTKVYALLPSTAPSTTFRSMTPIRATVYTKNTAEVTQCYYSSSVYDNPPATTYRQTSYFPVMTLTYETSPLTHTDTEAGLNMKVMTNAQLANEAIDPNKFYVNIDKKQLLLGSKELVGPKDGEWIKPADWIDVTQGAINNSIYLLIGHSADYSTYPEYAFYAETADNTQTFDVYVDGIKIDSYASGSTVTLDWQTLALTTGWDVTYPTALRTHIVRITPTADNGTLRQFYTKDYGSDINMGVLWMHLTFNEGLLGHIGLLGNSGGHTLFPVCEAVTTSCDCLKLNAYGFSFANCTALQTIPVLDGSKIRSLNTTNNLFRDTFNGCHSLKKVILQNIDMLTSAGVKRGPSIFKDNFALKKIEAKNCRFYFGDAEFFNTLKLEKLPECFGITPASDGIASPADMTNFIHFAGSNKGSLKPFQLDFSREYHARFRIIGNSAYKIPLKSLVVNPNSPFNSAGSPQLQVTYTDLDRAALVKLFNSLPTVSSSQVCDITGSTGAADLTAEDLAIATGKGWTITR